MADVTCGTCALWRSAAPSQCRVTNAARASTDTCSLTGAQRKTLWVQSKRIANAGRATEVVIDSLTACAGGGHIAVAATVNGQPVTRDFEMAAFLQALSVGPVEAILPLMAEAVRMGGATTAAEAKAILEGGVFFV